jgi:hypothetical protein
MKRIFGVDLTSIDGINILNSQVILSELGPDLSAFPSEDDFSSWLELVPRRKHHREEGNQAEVAGEQESGGGCAANGGGIAVGQRFVSRGTIPQVPGTDGGEENSEDDGASPACLVYRLLTKGQEYVDRGAAYFESWKRPIGAGGRVGKEMHIKYSVPRQAALETKNVSGVTGEAQRHREKR